MSTLQEASQLHECEGKTKQDRRGARRGKCLVPVVDTWSSYVLDGYVWIQLSASHGGLCFGNLVPIVDFRMRWNFLKDRAQWSMIRSLKALPLEEINVVLMRLVCFHKRVVTKGQLFSLPLGFQSHIAMLLSWMCSGLNAMSTSQWAGPSFKLVPCGLNF